MSSSYVDMGPNAGSCEEESKMPLRGECSYSNKHPGGKALLNFKPDKTSKNGNLSSRSEVDELEEDTENSIIPRYDANGFRSPSSAGPLLHLQGREVVFAILVFLFFSISVGLIVVLASNQLKVWKEEKKQEDLARDWVKPQVVCQTADCMKTAVAMMERMDPTADPCVDFWQYACGGYVDKVKIPSSFRTWGVDSDLKQKIDNNIRNILEEPISTSALPETAEWKLKTFYNKCMDTQTIDDLGAAPLLEVIDEEGGWAVLEDWNLGEKSGRWNFQAFLERLHFKYLTYVFFNVYVTPDDKASHKYMMELDQGGLGLSRKYYFRSDANPTVVAYKEYMRTVAKLMKAKTDTIEHFVNQSFTFEKNLAKIHMDEDAEERINTGHNYNKITIQELQVLAPRIHWDRYVKYNFSEYFALTNNITITSRDYMANLSRLIENTEERFIDGFASKLLSKPFREAKETFNHKRRGTTESGPRWKICMDMVNDWFGMALSAMFVKHHFSEKSREDVLLMVESIKSEFDRQLAVIDWMDEDTKAAAREKLKVMKEHVGYPTFITKEELVNQLYETFTFSEKDSFFQIDVNGVHHELIQMSNNLMQQRTDKALDEWAMAPHEVNAYYSPTENAMVFPAGFLQSPHYSPNVPEYVNFGAIGTTVGHEMTHGFDDTGSQFDKNGDFSMWWSPTSHDMFKNKTKCVDKYYSTLEMHGNKLNGQLTLGENIADMGGLEQAFYAYKRWEEKNGQEDLMPGLRLSNEKVFFLSFAQSYCLKRGKQDYESLLRSRRHAPDELRVNGTLAQFKAFSETYRCGPTKPMNSSTKCKVW